MTGSGSFWHVKKTGWLFAAAAAFILTVADCMCRNRDADVYGNPLFPQVIIVSAVSFASFACIFLLPRFFLSASLLAAGGVCVFFFAPDVRAPYLFVALPALLTVFLLRYCSLPETRKPIVSVAYGVLSVLELIGIVYLLRGLIGANTSFLPHILPFLKWKGRLNNNDYGLVLLFFLFALYVFFSFRQARAPEKQPEKQQKKNGKQKKKKDAAKTKPNICVWLRFAAVCLFFVSAVLWCLQSAEELFLPVSSFVNLVAVFVLCCAASVTPPEAIMNSKSAEVSL